MKLDLTEKEIEMIGRMRAKNTRNKSELIYCGILLGIALLLTGMMCNKFPNISYAGLVGVIPMIPMFFIASRWEKRTIQAGKEFLKQVKEG